MFLRLWNVPEAECRTIHHAVYTVFSDTTGASSGLRMASRLNFYFSKWIQIEASDSSNFTLSITQGLFIRSFLFRALLICDRREERRLYI